MNKTTAEIARLINGVIVGDANILIRGFASITEAKEGDITFLDNPRYLSLLETTAASAVVTSKQIKSASKTLIQVDNPSLAFVQLLSLVMPKEKRPSGVHPTAVLGNNVKLGKNVSIGAYTVIDDNAIIGDNTVIYPHCFIGHDSQIGSDCLIYSGVSIRERIIIGSRVIIHSGAVVGSDGFGFVTAQGVHHKIPQLGIVEVGDDVEIGANVTIDRARFDKTVIGKGTKIDNLVHIAHNVVVGENCLIVAQVGISGSTTLGKGVILAGQAGLVGHIHIGDGVVVAAQSGVSKSIPDYTQVWGTPAKPFALAKRINACIQRLPYLYKIVEEIKRKIERLEEKSLINK